MLNFNCTILDSAIVTIGDRTLIGLIYANHLIDLEERLKGVFYNRPITIRKRVWLGANVTILPGVTIGDEVVIGAGYVVIKSIPQCGVAVGNSCKILRLITEKDKIEN